MINYLQNNYGNRPSVNEGERMELEFLTKEVAKLEKQLAGLGGEVKGNSTASGHSSCTEDSEDEHVAELPEQKPVKRATGPRQSVSAEVFGKFNK